MRRYTDDLAVDVPEGECGSVRVERFTIERDLESLRMDIAGRGCTPGTYTKLLRNGALWMSDTDAERRDHLEPAYQINRRGGRVLLGGLGLGMILRVALLADDVERVDVVEIDGDVLELVGPHYAKLAAEEGKELVLHHADLYEIKWPPRTRWQVAWFDIWGDVSTDDLADMTRLRRSYGNRTDWNDCWGRHMLLAHRDRGGWW